MCRSHPVKPGESGFVELQLNRVIPNEVRNLCLGEKCDASWPRHRTARSAVQVFLSRTQRSFGMTFAAELEMIGFATRAPHASACGAVQV
jgi:hypothetical protein